MDEVDKGILRIASQEFCAINSVLISLTKLYMDIFHHISSQRKLSDLLCPGEMMIPEYRSGASGPTY